MRIFCISGSRNKRSVGAELAKLLQKKFNDVGDKTDFYIGENLNLSSCNGCSTCFDNGICPLDDVDGFNSVKENILEADLVIIISPVYVNNVSGIIKNFIDRLYLIFSQYRNVPRQLSIELTPKDISVPLYPIILFELGYKIIEPSDERLLTFERISN